MTQVYRLLKTTGTHGDALAASGLAHLLARISRPDDPRTVTLRDAGGWYEIEVRPDVEEPDVAAWDGDPFYPYVSGVWKKEGEVPPGAIDYKEESRRLEEKRKAAAAKPKRRKGATAVDAETEALTEAAEEPHGEIRLLRALNSMRQGFAGDVQMNVAIRRAVPKDVLASRLVRLREPMPSEYSEGPPFAVDGFSASQWFLPLAGKGANRVKGDGAGPCQFPARFLDWFETWMRYVGMYQSMTASRSGDDMCVMVPMPADIPLPALNAVREHLRTARIGRGNLEICAIIETCRALILHSEEYVRDEKPLFRFLRKSPAAILSGLHFALFKKMGTASSIMNVSVLGVPGWFPISTRQDAEAWLETLTELDEFQWQFVQHGTVIDVDILRHLRECLAQGTLSAALGFLARMPVAVMGRLTAKQFTRLLSESSVRRMVMAFEPPVGRIIDDPGFRSFAKAIRAVTIHAMLHSETRVVEPFYGLAQTWKQHAGDKARMAALFGKFLQEFNQTVSRSREMDAKKGRAGRYYPGLLMEDDLAGVLKLMEEPGSSSALVTHLLLGFGYAQVKRTSGEAPAEGKE